MTNEYWLIDDVIRNEDDCFPVGEIMIRGTFEEASERAKKYNFKSFKLVKMEIVSGRFVKEESRIYRRSDEGEWDKLEAVIKDD